MNKVVHEFKAVKYMVLELDEKKTPDFYKKYSIDGKEYDIVPISNAPNCIAVESSDSFLGKTVKYI